MLPCSGAEAIWPMTFSARRHCRRSLRRCPNGWAPSRSGVAARDFLMPSRRSIRRLRHMDWIFFHFRQSFRTDDGVFAKTTKLPKQTRFVENRSPAETLVGRTGLGKRYYEIITAVITQD